MNVFANLATYFSKPTSPMNSSSFVVQDFLTCTSQPFIIYVQLVFPVFVPELDEKSHFDRIKENVLRQNYIRNFVFLLELYLKLCIFYWKFLLDETSKLLKLLIFNIGYKL